MPPFETEGGVRAALIYVLNAVGIVATAPLGLMARLESALAPAAEGCFLFGAQLLAGVPGYVGVYFRRAFYWWTLDACSLRCFIGYGAYFTTRHSVVADHVYVGPYALVGSARLDRWCLVGSRASLLSRGNIHALDGQGRWLPSDHAGLEPLHVGTHAWIGEGAILLANVGAGAMIAAGSVVSTPVADHVMVGGNPARFVKALRPVSTPEGAASEAVT